MAVVMKQFIDKFKAMEKVANETLAANPEALVGVDSLPGSEHDAPVPADAEKPDKEVAQGQPAGAASTAGAVNGGDAKPLNEGKLEMDQSLLNPEKKPLISDDALTAKTANAHLTSLVKDLLADIQGGAQKQAQCGGAAKPASKPAETPKAGSKKDDKKDGEEKKAEKQTIHMNNELISKIAAAQATFMAGRKAAENILSKKASDNASAARNLIKAACIKAAQEQGLDPAAAAAAADNAMAAAGMAPADAAAAADAAGAADAADAAGTDAAAAGADAAAADAAAAGADAGIPEDVTEEELATAIVDLVSSGELDPDTAKALVEEIAGDEGAAAGPTEDQAAEIIAQGLENGEITPEQAQEIATAIESGDMGDAGADAAAADVADAEAQGAADAEAAIQDAADEAQGAADAEAAMKSAAEHIRSATIQKVASAVVANRQKAAKPEAGSRILSKVASILKDKADKAKAEKTASSKSGSDLYAEGFRKKAEAMGVDPSALAKYVLDRQAK